MNTYNYKELNPTAQKTAAYAIREAMLPSIEREINDFIVSARTILGRVAPVHDLHITLAQPHSKPHLKYVLTVPKNWHVDDRQRHYLDHLNTVYEEYNEGELTATGNHTDSYILRRLEEHPLELTGNSIAETIKYAVKEFQASIVSDLTDEYELNHMGLTFDEWGHVIPD